MPVLRPVRPVVLERVGRGGGGLVGRGQPGGRRVERAPPPTLSTSGMKAGFSTPAAPPRKRRRKKDDDLGKSGCSGDAPWATPPGCDPIEEGVGGFGRGHLRSWSVDVRRNAHQVYKMSRVRRKTYCEPIVHYFGHLVLTFFFSIVTAYIAWNHFSLHLLLTLG